MKTSFKLIFTSILLFLSSLVIMAQDDNIDHQAPTLQVGLNGLSFGKGDLDAQLIMEIIADKQSEVKLKIIQNMFLDNLENSGGTVYNYGSNLLKVMIEETNQETRTRLALENTVNLVFAYSFSQYMLKTDNKVVDSLLKSFELKRLDINQSINYPFSYKKKCFSKRKKRITTLPDIDTKEKNKDNFYALILDISSEVIRNNSRLKELGLMRISYSTSYEYLNKYRILEKERTKTSDDSIRWERAKELYKLMEGKLDSTISYVGVLNHFAKSYSFDQNILSMDILNDSIYNTILNDSINKEIKNTITKISDKWVIVNDSISSKAIKELYYCNELITRIQKNYSMDSKLQKLSDIIFLLNNKVIPLLQKNSKYNPDLFEKITEIEKTVDVLAQKILEKDSITFKNINPEQIQGFIKLVSTIYEFDRSTTYSDYLNLLSDIDNLFINQKIKTALSSLNSYVKNNVVIKKDMNGKEVIDFNIESFLNRISTTSSDKIRRFQFHFTVGANNVYFVDELTFSDGTKINNNSFISEKIGIKYKIINRGAWLPKNIGESYGSLGFGYVKTTPPKEPLVSNIHLLIYGSGILYNITTTSTNENFNYPIIGSGIGLTFYNALDLNLTIGLPLQSNLDFNQNFAISRSFIGLGFDIQFAEYINHLGQKRKNKLSQKRLSK